MFKKLSLVLTFSLLFLVPIAFGQRREKDPENVETSSSGASRQSESRASESSSSSSNNSSSSSSSSSSSTSSSSNDSSSSSSSSSNDSFSRERSERSERPSKRDRESDSDNQRPNRRHKDEDGGGNPRKNRTPEKPEPQDSTPIEGRPVEVPVDSNNPNNPNQNPPNANNNRNRNKDNDNDDRKRRRNRGGGYPYPPTFPDPYPSSTTPTKIFSWRDYFNENDVFFNTYSSYVESDSAKYLPYFESVLSGNYEPLYYVYGREFFLNEFPFISNDWTVYYEPELGDVFVNFAKIGKTDYERMVWFPVGETIKKVNKKFKYKGDVQRPLLVETLPLLASDKIYSFSVKELPKGEYEIRFIARDGSIVKHFLRIK